MIEELKILTGYCGLYNYASVKEYVSLGGYQGLKKALAMKLEDVINEIVISNLMGRGGAAYPTGEKWDMISRIDNDPKYIVCNADEGEPGTFKDRKLIYNDPMKIIEGMTIAAHAISSKKGYIYIRGEYREGYYRLREAIRSAKAAGYLGSGILGTTLDFDIEVVSGAGAYVCGENSALCESIEGKSGRPRLKPPYIKNVGIYGQPTLVNNVETFSCIPYIVEKGGKNYAGIGTETSAGTKLISVSGNVKKPGVFEIPFGVTLREIVYDLAGGVEGGSALKFVQMGGASGACFTDSDLDTRLDYKELRSKRISIGSGAIVVADQTNCAVDYALMTMEFFLHESCGKCTPCREGNAQLCRILKNLASGTANEKQVRHLENISQLMMKASSCGLGKAAPTAVLTLYSNFKEEFLEHVEGHCRTGSCNISLKKAAV